MIFRTTHFSPVGKHQDYNSCKEHPLKETTPPFSPAQMLRRMANGQPLSAAKPPQNFPINNKFFTEKFDVIDTAIALNRKLNKEQVEKIKATREEQKRLHQEFLEWKKNQDVVVDPPKSVEPLQQSNT